jgi:hypothetical protein
MYSPLTTRPRRAAPRRIMLLRMNTPVNVPAHAFATSKVTALVAPIACATAMLIGGSNRWTKPSRYFVMLQLTTTSRSAASCPDLRKQSSAAPVASE